MRLHLVLVAFVASVSATSLVNSVLALTCIQYFGNYNFGCKLPMNMTCVCRNDLWIALVMDCVLTHNTSEGERNHAVWHTRRRCFDRSNHQVKLVQLGMERIWHDNPASPDVPSDAKATLTKPFHAQGDKFDFAYNSYKSLKHNTDNSYILGWGFIYYWALIVVVGGVFHWVLGSKRFRCSGNSFNGNCFPS